jgi:hypothetical protein
MRQNLHERQMNVLGISFIYPRLQDDVQPSLSSIHRLVRIDARSVPAVEVSVLGHIGSDLGELVQVFLG